jgi:beta-lactamase class A
MDAARLLLSASAAAAALAVCAPAARAGDGALMRVLAAHVPEVARTTTVQETYDAARDLQEGLRVAGPVSRGCAQLARTARAYAAGTIQFAEGVDRPSATMKQAGLRRASHAYVTLLGLRLRCPAGRAPRRAPQDVILSPRPFAAFFGTVIDELQGADEARLYVAGRRVQTVRWPSANVRFRVPRRPGRYDLEVRQLRRGHVIHRAFAGGAWLLPRSALRARAAGATDPAIARRLATLGSSFRGYAGFWVHDLRSGRTAGWNADSRFPAASTVKLAVLVEALRRFHGSPVLTYDLRALARWSSNLAANRLLRKIGGPGAAEAALRRLGARSSTYPGDYRVGTSVRADAPRQPPSVSARVTTARDLGRILWVLHAAAVGNRYAQRVSGLDRELARLAVGLLLDSEARGNNVGLRPMLPLTTLIAQKNGWTSEVRHTAAIVYGPRGPTIVVVLAYRPGLGRSESLALRRRVLAVVRP